MALMGESNVIRSRNISHVEGPGCDRSSYYERARCSFSEMSRLHYVALDMTDRGMENYDAGTMRLSKNYSFLFYKLVLLRKREVHAK